MQIRDFMGFPVNPGFESGYPIMGFDYTNSQAIVLACDNQGQLIPGPSGVGGNDDFQPDTAVGAFMTALLPAPPGNALSQFVQNTGPEGSLIRVRGAGQGPGNGIILPRFGILILDKAISQLEAEDVAGIATSVAIAFERL